jgi:hypothetical protein
MQCIFYGILNPSKTPNAHCAASAGTCCNVAANQQAEIDLTDLITQSEAAELRGVSLAAIANLVQRSRLTKYEQYDKSLVSRREVEALEDKRGF